MANLTSVGITSGVPSSGTGTVSTIDNLISTAGSPSSSVVLTMQSAATVLATVAANSSFNSTNLKSASAVLYSAHFYNNSSLPRFVKITNLASAPTVGTASVSFTIGVAPGNFRDLNFVGALSSVGLGYFITGAIGSSDTTAISSNDIMGAIEYA